MIIVGIAGSLREKSYNSALLRAAVRQAPKGIELEIASISGIPLYDGDVEAAEGVPPAVEHLKERIAAADGLLLSTPEYNHSIPGVFKNAIDWLSRPPKDIGRVFGGKPVAMMGATPGGGGTTLAQQAWLPVLATLGMRPWFGTALKVARAGQVFDEEERELVDDAIRDRLRNLMSGFVAFCEEQKRARSER